jgi:hypothetical protein
MYTLKSEADRAERQSPAHPHLVYAALMRLRDELKAIADIPPAQAEAAASAMRAQEQEQEAAP